MNSAEIIAQPITLMSGETIANRLVKSAMTEGLADRLGEPSEELCTLYRTWSQGGAGVLISGNVQVDRKHLERPGNVVLDSAPSPATLDKFRRWADAARSAGNGLWMQISHAGRQTQGFVNPHPKGPSDIAIALPGKLFGKPTPLTESEIRELIDRFVGAVVSAQKAGFSGAQIHAAHGYLLSSFLSPIANNRRDDWGGTLENRARFLLDIVKQSRSAVGSRFTISVKLNSADFQRGGFAFEDSLQVASWLEAAGIDVLEISGGTYEQPKMFNLEGIEKTMETSSTSTGKREAYFVDFATKMRQTVKTPLLVTGGFRTLDGMAKAIDEHGIALLGLARPLCVDPSAPKKLLAGESSLDRTIDELRLGPGIFSERSSIAFLKAINAFAVASWFYQQIRLMGKGKKPDPSLGIFLSLLREQWIQRRQLAQSK